MVFGAGSPSTFFLEAAQRLVDNAHIHADVRVIPLPGMFAVEIHIAIRPFVLWKFIYSRLYR
ncbi:hypothetical protein ASE05_31800 [Mesorhizobium sp. Root172]|nr:hypothetical protein ASE05_31800 [Mesorhizobium sp. Root172]